MRWFVADKGYVNFLSSIDQKVEQIDYGDKLKPYFGIVLEINNHNYYLPVSSAKEKHKNMKNSKDFQKICDKDTGELIAVININNMIPIPSQYVIKLNYDQVDHYRTFESDLAKSQYIDLLRKELDIITSLSDRIKENALYVYEHFKQYPNDRLSSRCCNFVLLEEKSKEYPIECPK
ncbi:type III toxin-antitoxin system ToxN/AbiQ family toxin [Dehalobacter sp. TBBPA1]|uniref:type III toxin-antitoxin system ToxN/AbiQ family toxin n=1 Tax=Dehalobacter sp. TBBPA1 TaxID=3235037 RepID=UPI0034A13B91